MLEHGNGVAIRPRAFCTVLIPGQVPQQSATSLCSCCTNSRLAAACEGAHRRDQRRMRQRVSVLQEEIAMSRAGAIRPSTSC